MEFYHLRSFVAVANTGNLSLAAKRLYTTPPAISAHIKSLEAELATPLFDRSSKGMMLTEKGKILLEKAQLTLDSAIDIVNLAAHNQNEIIGRFTLGLNTCAEKVKLAPLVQLLSERCAGINLVVQSQSTGKTLTEIQNGVLDGGYIFGDIPDDCFSIKVLNQDITTIAPMNITGDSTITSLRQQPWIMMSDYCPFDSLLTEKLGKSIHSVLKSADDSSRLALVTSGLGLSFLEKEAALNAAKNKHIQIISSLDFTTPLSFVISKKRVNEPVINAVFDAIRMFWSKAK